MRKLGAAFVLAVMVLAVTALPALANHVTQGSVDCDGWEVTLAQFSAEKDTNIAITLNGTNVESPEPFNGTKTFSGPLPEGVNDTATLAVSWDHEGEPANGFSKSFDVSDCGVQHGPITICHRTNAVTNPYVVITVDDDSVKLKGHQTHTGPVPSPATVANFQILKDNHTKWGDIIPPTLNDGVTPTPGGSLNWDGNQAFYDGGCKPTPTPPNEVTPLAPRIAHTTVCEQADSLDVTPVEHITYYFDGEPVTHLVGPAAGVITAVPDEGYVIAAGAQDEFKFELDLQGPCPEVKAVTAIVGPNCPHNVATVYLRNGGEVAVQFEVLVSGDVVEHGTLAVDGHRVYHFQVKGTDIIRTEVEYQGLPVPGAADKLSVKAENNCNPDEPNEPTPPGTAHTGGAPWVAGGVAIALALLGGTALLVARKRKTVEA